MFKGGESKSKIMMSKKIYIFPTPPDATQRVSTLPLINQSFKEEDFTIAGT